MGPGRCYTLTWDAATAISAAIDIFEVAPADDKPVFLDELAIWNLSDFGDAQDEILTVQIINGYTASGSGGASATVGRQNPGDAAASFTAECRNTTLASTGTAYVFHEDGWQVRSPYLWTPTDAKWVPYGTQAAPLYVRLPVAPADAITMKAQAKVREIG